MDTKTISEEKSLAESVRICRFVIFQENYTYIYIYPLCIYMSILYIYAQLSPQKNVSDNNRKKKSHSKKQEKKRKRIP